MSKPVLSVDAVQNIIDEIIASITYIDVPDHIKPASPERDAYVDGYAAAISKATRAFRAEARKAESTA
ncbi:hypothetical protein NLL32_00685 [Corynebacterium propinquum]|uniref:hypothetical protein n=1 Tax=Corynebacterium propinquum TaxID=43769 RepID=UPI002543A51F|nr:hypothetical protein [Corynebacterium propinquum]MDK4252615.1 hypothetical protein [Corynebacterium propinquum]WKS49448.1 hypothetical protein NLL32_00685 [Corynebacterium propinquum]